MSFSENGCSAEERGDKEDKTLRYVAPAKHALGINPRPGSTLVHGENMRCQAAKPSAWLQASSSPRESLPDTSCCPGNPTGTMPKLFMAVAQAVGSVTDMFSWVASIAMLPKPSAAAGGKAN